MCRPVDGAVVSLAIHWLVQMSAVSEPSVGDGRGACGGLLAIVMGGTRL